MRPPFIILTILTVLLSHPCVAEGVRLQGASPATSGDKTYAFMDIPVGTDSATVGTLGLEVENFSFFKDNEFSGEQSKGYSLPGFWLQPRLTYQPLESVRLEAGFHAAVFDGANKYPCYAYHDIGMWKGNQYQRGAHVLPFFRATARLGVCTFVLGDLYGGVRHGLVEPLLNPEVDLTQDPEMGFQVKLQLPRYRMDAWVNWQSYIFEEDTHQEAFTVGLSQQVWLTPPAAAYHWYIPVNVVAQHRGGEQDVTDMGVQTLCNAAAGLGLRWNAGLRVLDALNVEAVGLLAYQQSGQLWPFDTGGGASVSVRADLRQNIRVYGGVTYVKDFVSLYGVPFYSTVSQKSGGRFEDMLSPHVGVEWSHTFAQQYVLGAKLDAYLSRAGRLSYIDTDVHTGQPALMSEPAAFSNNFSFGVYFRCCPRFVLWRK